MYLGLSDLRLFPPPSSAERFSPHPFSQRSLAPLSPATVSSFEAIRFSTERIAPSRSFPSRSLYLKSFSLMSRRHSCGISLAVVPNRFEKSSTLSERQRPDASELFAADFI